MVDVAVRWAGEGKVHNALDIDGKYKDHGYLALRKENKYQGKGNLQLILC